MFLSSYPWTRWNLPRFHSHLKIRGVLRMQVFLSTHHVMVNPCSTTRAGRILWCCSLILLLITHYFLFFKAGVGGSIFYHSGWFLDFFKLMQDLHKKSPICIVPKSSLCFHLHLDQFPLKDGTSGVPWTARRLNQSILKEINPEYSLEGLILKLKLQYFGHLIQRANSLEKAWCWRRLRTGGEGDDRGWNSWVASLTHWTWVWANSRS